MSKTITLYIPDGLAAQLDQRVAQDNVHKDRSGWSRQYLPIMLARLDLDLVALVTDLDLALTLSRDRLSPDHYREARERLNQIRAIEGLPPAKDPEDYRREREALISEKG